MEEAELSSSGASSFSFSDTSLAVRVKDEQESIWGFSPYLRVASSLVS